MRRPLAVLLVAAVASGALLATGSPAAAACTPSTLPDTALRQLADGVPVAGKKVGTEWQYVVLGTVTEVRHRSPKYRYRITMHVDSVIGGDLPGLYTFFGSSRGTYPFEVGKVYAVPLTKRTKAPIGPTTELWAESCDPVVLIPDLPAAHEIVASTKPGYVAPSPTPAPTPTETESEAAGSSPAPSATVDAEPVAAVQDPQISVPSDLSVGLLVRRGIVALGVLALLIAIAAVAESRWSRRHYA